MRLGIVNYVGRHLAYAISIGLCLSWATQAQAGWQSKTAMPAPVAQAAIESVDGIVYVVGGFNSTILSSVYAYDPTTNSWTTKASLPGPRYDGNGAAVINSQLYVAGGWTVSPPLPNNNLFVYDPPTNTWTSKASMPHLSGCGASGAIRGKLYVTTPCNGFSGLFNLLDVYDPATDSWSSLAGSNSPHANPAFGVINDKLYVAGGQDGNGNEITNVLEVYDPLTNVWTTLAPMPTAVLGPASVALNGRLYVISGSSTSGTPTLLPSVQVYDPHTNQWVVLSSPSVERSAATVAYGIVFLEGGLNSSSTTVSTNLDLVLTPSIP